MAKKKGYYASEMNTWDAAKQKQILEQYGKEGLTENTYNWLRSRVKANDEELASLKANNPAMTTLRGQTTSGLDVGYVDPSTIVVHPTEADINKYLYNADEKGGTYYGGTLSEVDANGKKTKATNASAVDFLNEYQNDPATLFNPNYSETRKQITDKQWIQLIERHPEYWNSATSRYIPDSVQTKLMQRGIRQATDKAAGYVVQALLGATNPLAAIASLTGAAFTDEIVDLASKKYTGWQDMVASKLRDKGVDNDLIVNTISALSNPGALVGGVLGGFATPTYSFTASPLESVKIAGQTRDVYTGADLAHPTITTGKKEVEIPSGMAETTIQGYSNIPVLGTRTVASKTAAVPAGPGGGLGIGRGRIGGGGKGLNPSGQMTTTYGLVPKVIRGDMTMNLPYATISGMPPIEYTLSDHPTILRTTLPDEIPYGKPWKVPDFYQTGYDWGDPEFQTWWRQNAPGNEGKVLDYKGRKIKIEWDPEGYRRTNIHTGVPGGAYPQGSITSREVIGERHLTPPQPIVIPANSVVMSNPALTPYKVTLGNTVTLKQGGSLNYLNYIK